MQVRFRFETGFRDLISVTLNPNLKSDASVPVLPLNFEDSHGVRECCSKYKGCAETAAGFLLGA